MKNIKTETQMMIKKSDKANPNYLATICRIEQVYPIENTDRLVRTVINGYDMVISKDIPVGSIVVYFPCETSISEKYLSANNLYEQSEFEKNSNAQEIKELTAYVDSLPDDKKLQVISEIKSKCGFFNKYGRVRIIKLRGEYSQGFIAGVETLINAWPELKDINWNDLVGTQFNMIGEDEVCKKYIPPIKINDHHQSKSQWQKRMNKLKRFDNLIDGQFEFHYDTTHLGEHINELHPNHYVSVSLKLHGTSCIISNILCNRKLNIWERLKKKLGFKVRETEYSNIYSARSVIKNRYLTSGKDYYESDIWGCVNRDFSKYLSEGMTVYGEIVGYIEGSKTMIQENHDYGCEEGTWKFMPYRITTTNDDGSKKEWNVIDVWRWTANLKAQHPEIQSKLIPIQILYYGELGNMYPELDINQHWHQNLLQMMKDDKNMLGMELDEPLCKNKVPREGVVIRIEGDRFKRAWKLKCKRHYECEAKAHDNDEIDIEETA